MFSTSLFICISHGLVLNQAATSEKNIQAGVFQTIQGLEDSSWGLAKKIWELAEPGYLEKESSRLLSENLEKHGFQIERGVAGIPTAFTATNAPT